MPKTKQRKNHTQKVNNYKNKIKQMSKEQQNGQVPQMPEIRNIPTWDKDAEIIVPGSLWEIIYNGFAQISTIAQAINSVMTTNVLSGVIGMDFQKLDPQTLNYADMTEDEKKPLREDFAKMLENMRKTVEAMKTQEAVAEQAIPIDSPVDDAVPKTAIIESESQPTEGKLVTMNSK